LTPPPTAASEVVVEAVHVRELSALRLDHGTVVGDPEAPAPTARIRSGRRSSTLDGINRDYPSRRLQPDLVAPGVGMAARASTASPSPSAELSALNVSTRSRCSSSQAWNVSGPRCSFEAFNSLHSPDWTASFRAWLDPD
jgi:hypothetical protein